MSFSKHRLDDFCEIIMGQAPSGEAYNFEGKGWPLIAGAGDFGEVYPKTKKYTTEASKISRYGDIILGIRASIGDKVLSDGEYCLGRGVACLRPRSKLDSRYLWHWLDSIRDQLSSKSKGATFKQVNRSDISELDISLPPLEEQRRIAEILDRAEELRYKRQEAITLLDTLTQAIFIEMFGDPVTNSMGWPLLHLQDALSMPLRNGLSPSNTGKVTSKVLTLSAITGNAFDETAWKTSTFQSVPPINQRVDQSDFLICRGNGNIQLVGKGYFPTRQMPEVTFPDTMIAARILPERIERDFLQHVWNSSAVRRQVEALARTTNGTFKVNQTMLEGVVFVIPPLPLQQEFTRRVEAVEKLKTAHRASLSELNALFASLQHRAFRGEL